MKRSKDVFLVLKFFFPSWESHIKIYLDSESTQSNVKLYGFTMAILTAEKLMVMYIL